MTTAPKCSTRIFDYYRIPSGSRVELWTEGQRQNYDTVALVEADDRRWTIGHPDLHRSADNPTPPASFEVTSNQRYVVTYFTNFRSGEEVDVVINLRIVIIDPDSGDSRIRKPVLRCSVAGSLFCISVPVPIIVRNILFARM